MKPSHSLSQKHVYTIPWGLLLSKDVYTVWLNIRYRHVTNDPKDWTIILIAHLSVFNAIASSLLAIIIINQRWQSSLHQVIGTFSYSIYFGPITDSLREGYDRLFHMHGSVQLDRSLHYSAVYGFVWANRAHLRVSLKKHRVVNRTTHPRSIVWNLSEDYTNSNPA